MSTVEFILSQKIPADPFLPGGDRGRNYGIFARILKRTGHYKISLTLALPVMLGQLGHIMAAVADSLMVGQLGTFPLAAVAFANSIFAIFMVFGLGLGFGMTPLVAKADGQRMKHLPSSLLRHGFWINLAMGIGLFLLLMVIVPLMNFMDQDPEVVALAKPYFVVLSASIVPLMLFTTFKQFAEGLSDTKMAMVVSLIFNLLNILLNYLLIFGHWGFPELGVVGAGWATFIARMGMFLAMWGYVATHRKFKKHNFNLLAISLRRKIYRRILQVGFPTGLQYIFEISAFSLAAVFAGMISANALAAHQIAINIASVSYMAVTGLGAAATVRVGNQIGRRDRHNLKLATKSIFVLAGGWMAFAGIVIFIFKNTLAGFYSDAPDVISLAAQMLIVVVLFQLSDGLQAVALGTLRGFTDVRVPTFITFVVYWLLTFPAAYLLSQHTSLGAMGIWYSLAGGLTLSAAMLGWRVYNRISRFGMESF